MGFGPGPEADVGDAPGIAIALKRALVMSSASSARESIPWTKSSTSEFGAMEGWASARRVQAASRLMTDGVKATAVGGCLRTEGAKATAVGGAVGSAVGGAGGVTTATVLLV